MPSDTDQIRRLLADYCQAADDGRFADYAACFAPDGVLNVPGHSFSRDRLVALNEVTWAARERQGPATETSGVKHLHCNSEVYVRGQTASCDSDIVMVELTPARGWRILGTGRYHDLLRKDADGWRITSRTVSWYGGRKDYEAEDDQRMAGLYATAAAA